MSSLDGKEFVSLVCLKSLFRFIRLFVVFVFLLDGFLFYLIVFSLFSSFAIQPSRLAQLNRVMNRISPTQPSSKTLASSLTLGKRWKTVGKRRKALEKSRKT